MAEQPSSRHEEAHFDFDSGNPVTRLLEKRKQMRQVQEALDAQKENYLHKEELFKIREEKLRKRDLEIQEALVLFNKFLKENEHKRRRAEHKAQEEAKQKQLKQVEVEALRRRLADMQDKKRKLEKKVRQYEKYQAFLQQVCDDQHGHPFDDISAIINRYVILEANHNDLVQAQESQNHQFKLQRDLFTNFKKQQVHSHLALNTKVDTCSKMLEEAVKSAGDAQDRMVKEERQMMAWERDTTLIVMAVNNIFERAQHSLHRVIKHGIDRKEQIASAGRAGVLQIAGVVGAKGRQGSEKKEVQVPLDPLTERREDAFRKLDVIKLYLDDFDKIISSITGDSSHRHRFSAGVPQAVYRSSLAALSPSALSPSSASAASVFPASGSSSAAHGSTFLSSDVTSTAVNRRLTSNAK